MKIKLFFITIGLSVLIMTILSCANTMWLYNNNTIGIIGDFRDFSPDGKYIVTAYNNSIKLWDIKSEREIKNFENERIRFKGFSPDGKIMVTSIFSGTGGGDDSLILWDVDSGRQIKTIDPLNKAAYIYYGGFSPDGKILVTYQAEARNKIVYRLWDVTNGELYRAFCFERSYFFPISFTPDSKQMYTVFDVLLKWNVDIGDRNNEIYIYKKNGQLPNGVTTFTTWFMNSRGLSSDGKYFISYSNLFNDFYNRIPSYNKNINVQNFQTGEIVFRIFDFNNSYIISSVYLSSDAKQISALIGTWDRNNFYNFSFIQWDTDSGDENNIGSCNKYKKSFFIGRIKYDSLHPRLTPDYKNILFVDQNNSIILMDSENGNVIKTFTGHTKKIASLHIHPNMEKLISVSEDNTVRIWDF